MANRIAAAVVDMNGATDGTQRTNGTQMQRVQTGKCSYSFSQQWRLIIVATGIAAVIVTIALYTLGHNSHYLIGTGIIGGGTAVVGGYFVYQYPRALDRSQTAQQLDTDLAKAKNLSAIQKQELETEKQLTATQEQQLTQVKTLLAEQGAQIQQERANVTAELELQKQLNSTLQSEIQAMHTADTTLSAKMNQLGEISKDLEQKAGELATNTHELSIITERVKEQEILLKEVQNNLFTTSNTLHREITPLASELEQMRNEHATLTQAIDNLRMLQQLPNNVSHTPPSNHVSHTPPSDDSFVWPDTTPPAIITPPAVTTPLTQRSAQNSSTQNKSSA